MRNPDWTKEELTLALFVLRQIGDESLSQGDSRIQGLSELLNELPIHPEGTRGSPFRDPDGVRRRLSYLRQIERGESTPGHTAYRDVVERYPPGTPSLELEVNHILSRHGFSATVLVPTRFRSRRESS